MRQEEEDDDGKKYSYTRTCWQTHGAHITRSIDGIKIRPEKKPLQQAHKRTISEMRRMSERKKESNRKTKPEEDKMDWIEDWGNEQQLSFGC